MKRRLPAEWEDQDAVLLCWPHEHTDWAPYLGEARAVLLNIAAAVTRSERLIVAGPDPDTIRPQLERHGIDTTMVDICTVGTDDTWVRDSGPITVMDDGRPLLLDFSFNAWGGKFPCEQDNRLTNTLWRQGVFRQTPRQVVDMVLEGGSIESNGQGTLLTTTRCLLNPNRNPGMNQADVEAKLKAELGVTRILWLHHGFLEGDDTDSHIDTLARLCPDDTILHVTCDTPGDEHAEELAAMEAELRTFSTMKTGTDGRICEAAYRLLPLPWPNPVYDSHGARLPATYANFLVINAAVLVPAYNDPHDDEALAVVGAAFPGRQVVGIDCSTLIRQHGSLHCVTMQIPAGVF